VVLQAVAYEFLRTQDITPVKTYRRLPRQYKSNHQSKKIMIFLKRKAATEKKSKSIAKKGQKCPAIA